MTKTSFMDKLNIILEVSKSSKLFIAVIAIIVVLAVLAITMNKKNAKYTKNIYVLVYAFILIAILVAYSSSLGKMFDYMMNNLFIAIYFPNIAIYLAAIIITNIILLVSIFNRKITKLIKNLNVVMFSIMNYLLVLILSVVHKENLDVFTQTSIYGNRQVQALIELSSSVFMIWMAFLIVYKIIRTYQQKTNSYHEKPEIHKVIVEKKTRVLPSNIKEIKPLSVATIGTKNVVVEKRQRILPTNINEIKSPRYVKQLPSKEVVKPVRILPSNIKEIKPLELAKVEKPIAQRVVVERRERVLPTNIKEIKSPRYVKQLPTKQEQLRPKAKPQLKPAMTMQEIDMLLAPAYDKMFSLDDYKKMRDILVKKQQETKKSNNQEQLKFQQLKDLYESVI